MLEERAIEMSLAEGSSGSSSPASVALGDALAFFGIVADYAAAIAPEEGERVASLAAGLAKTAGLSSEQSDALYFAARLRNIGALGNAALSKNNTLGERELTMARWDIPADGARLCERIAPLPTGTADIVRWQCECWDGTGYPDQLRWSGVPAAPQLLHIAKVYARAGDPEEALTAISMESGRTFAPQHVRTFSMWFHTFGGEVESAAPPYRALDVAQGGAGDLTRLLSERIDVHNGVSGRAQRIAHNAKQVAQACGFDAETLELTELSAQLFGIGELRAAEVESLTFDPLARLGNSTRAGHAAAAARLAAQSASLSGAAAVLRARAEWYDGTGSPDGLRHEAIPPAARILAACIAYDTLDEAYRTHVGRDRTVPAARLESAVGTQFDPAVVRALNEVVKTGV